ncbi:hypothetical protein B0T14DRAFT_495837 [Immersiella caudata]|uniref:Uncharacterized protein n=1 Tax=Immersiella caudata TaxID=314043 RepID=A0AA40BZ03_9PEZI|nr:hypothetical protein B0T14DRAFT_495837 [Immersiella caudata]
MASIIRRDFNPHEQLVLVDCGIGTLPNGGSSSRQMAYYPSGHTVDGNTVQPEMIVNVPWDGSYPWRNSGVSAHFPNGDTFQVFIDPDTKDWDTGKAYAGSAMHSYDANPFKCWGEHGALAFTLADNTQCTIAYICYHEPPPPPPPQPEPEPPKQIKETQFTMSKTQIKLWLEDTDDATPNLTPAAAFAHIHDAIEGNQCKSSTYPIGDNCKISFDCTFTVPEKTDVLASVLTDAVAPVVAKTKENVQKRFAGICAPSMPCTPDRVVDYTVYEYPSTGKVLVRVYPEEDVDAVTLQAEVAWEDSQIDFLFAVTGTLLGVSEGSAFLEDGVEDVQDPANDDQPSHLPLVRIDSLTPTAPCYPTIPQNTPPLRLNPFPMQPGALPTRTPHPFASEPQGIRKRQRLGTHYTQYAPR